MNRPVFDVPPPLLDAAARAVAKKYELVSPRIGEPRTVYRDLSLPHTAVQAIYRLFRASIFRDSDDRRMVTENKPVHFLQLDGTAIGDKTFVTLLGINKDTLLSLSMRNCRQLSYSPNLVTQMEGLANLVALNFGSPNLTSPKNDPTFLNSALKFGERPQLNPGHISFFLGFISLCPNLLCLTLHGGPWEQVTFVGDEKSYEHFFKEALRSLPQLLYLDLSFWTIPEHLKLLQGRCDHLETLVLYDIPHLHHVMEKLLELTNLKKLDISQSTTKTGNYPQPAKTLRDIVARLRRLECLDISSTNLATNPASPAERNALGIPATPSTNRPYIPAPTNPSFARQTKPETHSPMQNLPPWLVKVDSFPSVPTSEIAALRGLSKPLTFLGLYNCNRASDLKNIPALSIAGEATEEQILNALNAFQTRPRLLKQVFVDMARFCQAGGFQSDVKAFRKVVQLMDKFAAFAEVVSMGSNVLFIIVKTFPRGTRFSSATVCMLLKVIQTHLDTGPLVEHFCELLYIVLCFGCKKSAYVIATKLMLEVVLLYPEETEIHKWATAAMDQIAEEAEIAQKEQIGRFGGIGVVLRLLLSPCYQGDVNLENYRPLGLMWSYISSITCDVPDNCQIFIQSHGLKILHKEFGRALYTEPLWIFMMYTLYNIAEIPQSRGHLYQKEYINDMLIMLDEYKSDGSAMVSYATAGALSFMVADSTHNWPPGKVDRDEVCREIVSAMQEIRAKPDIAQAVTNTHYLFRSFDGVVSLLNTHEYPAVKFWALSALTAMTSSHLADRAIRSIHRLDARRLLQNLRDDEQGIRELRRIAADILTNIDNFEKPQTVEAAS